jgi:ankyrin repeat protein
MEPEIPLGMKSFLHHLMKSLYIFLSRSLPLVDNDWWISCVVDKLPDEHRSHVIKNKITSLDALDLSKLLQIIDKNWWAIRNAKNIPKEIAIPAINYIRETIIIRNRWQGHDTVQGFPDDLYYRDLDTLLRFAEILEVDNDLIQRLRATKEALLVKMASVIRSADQRSELNEPKAAWIDVAPGHMPRPVDLLLIEASQSANWDEIELLLSKGAKIDTPGCKTTPLIEAIKKNDGDLTRFLLKKGANVNVQGLVTTPLLEAIYNNDHELVELLLANGADVNYSDECGQTPLILASRRGNLAIVRSLLFENPEVNRRGKNGFSAIMEALSNGHNKIVQLLHTVNAAINDKDKKIAEDPKVKAKAKAEAEAEARAKGKAEAEARAKARVEAKAKVKAAVKAKAEETAEESARRKAWEKALLNAIQQENVGQVKDLLKNRHNLPHGGIGVLCYGTFNFLTTAAKRGNLEMVELLVSAGAPLDWKKNKKSALEYAKEKGHQETVNFLLSKGAKGRLT